jgi:hypothetical protein
MSIVIVGGNDRMATRYKDICKAYDCKAKVFIKFATDLDKKIGSPDLAVVFSNTVSHKLLNGVNRQAVKQNFPVEICRSGSVSSLKKVLDKYCTSAV